MPGAGRRSARAATLVGLLVWFVAAVDLTRWIRLPLLLDVDPAWALPRLVLSLLLIGTATLAGALAAGAFLLWCRRSLGRVSPAPLPIRRPALVWLAAGAIALGALLRFVALEHIPSSLWIDDVSLIDPARALRGNAQDFADAVRPHPYGVARPYGSVGVLYLELYRASLHLFGTNVYGARLLFAFAGTLSLLTGTLLGRALLPSGGGTLVAVLLAGLRWHLILSRWSYAIVIAPVVDLATLLLLFSRRRQSVWGAAAAGLAVGLATHVYLSAWIAAAALLALSVWPSEFLLSMGLRLRLALLFCAGFGIAVLPLFVLRGGRTAAYFARVSDHSALREIERTRSFLPPFAAAADAIAGPWFLTDPTPRHDLPGQSRLGLLGIPLAVSLARSLRFPRKELSGLLLCHAAAALAASVAGGQADQPNGMRFSYLISVTAVAVAGGLLYALALLPEARRRLGALAVIGLVAILGALGARDALLRWPERQETFDGFHGQDTLLARTLLRWEPYGRVEFVPGLEHSRITVDGIVRYRLDPEELERRSQVARAEPIGTGAERSFRLMPPGLSAAAGEGLVEQVQDAWGRTWGLVLARRVSSAAGAPRKPPRPPPGRGLPR